MPRDPTTQRIFKTDVLREIGVDASSAQNLALQIALSEPSKYFQMRQSLLKAVVEDNITHIYNTVWNALTEGTKADDTVILVLGDTGLKIDASIRGAAVNFKPNFPESEVNAIAMSVARGFKDLMEQQLVNVILPPNLRDLAIEKTALRTTSKLASGGGPARVPEPPRDS